MKVEAVKIEDLIPDQANARKHDERNLSAIAASLQRFGQQKPIVVDSSGVVRAGNGTLYAAQSLGWKKIDVVRSGLENAEAAAYAIADNRTAELAEWDTEVLAQTLDQMDAETQAAAGFSEHELAEILKTLEPGVGEFPPPPERGPRSVTMVMTHEQGEVFDKAMGIAKGQGQGEKTATICGEWLG